MRGPGAVKLLLCVVKLLLSCCYAWFEGRIDFERIVLRVVV
jgi:hypothetical protein